MDIDISIETGAWESVGLESLVSQAMAALCGELSIPSDGIELAVLACDDAEIARLNAQFRGKPEPTNVLSWPAQDLVPPGLPQPDPDGTIPLGDIALAFETCTREAAAQGKSMRDHVTHLIVHGILHLLGYDHIIDADAARMEALERKILGKLGIDDPYMV